LQFKGLKQFILTIKALITCEVGVKRASYSIFVITTNKAVAKNNLERGGKTNKQGYVFMSNEACRNLRNPLQKYRVICTMIRHYKKMRDSLIAQVLNLRK